MLSILPLNPDDAGEVIAMIRDDEPGYRRHFSGLPEAPEPLADLIRASDLDAYWGIWKSPRELSAILMLRGLDAGYTAPAFGVYVRKNDSGRGLARLAMLHALSHCRLQSIPEIMLTVDEDNTPARLLYERMGFVRTPESSPKGQPIYRKKLDVLKNDV